MGLKSNGYILVECSGGRMGLKGNGNILVECSLHLDTFCKTEPKYQIFAFSNAIFELFL